MIFRNTNVIVDGNEHENAKILERTLSRFLPGTKVVWDDIESNVKIEIPDNFERNNIMKTLTTVFSGTGAQFKCEDIPGFDFTIC